MKSHKLILLVLSLFLLSSCTSFLDSMAVKVGYENKTKIEQQLISLKNEKDIALRDQEKKITDTKDADIKALRELFQQSMNWAYGVKLASNLQDQKDRLNQILSNRIDMTLSFGPPPTSAAIIEQNKTLKEELDTVRVSNTDLAARYKIKEEEAQNLRQSELDKQAEIARLQEVKRKSEEDFNKKIEDKQSTLTETTNKLLAKQDEQIRHEKDVKAMKEKGAAIVGALALLCIAGAIWSPVFKDKFGYGAVIFGLVAAAILYIEGWMIAVALGILGVAAIVFFAVKNHWIESKAATNTYRALEEIKNTATDEYTKVIAPKLAEWQTKYKNGKIIPDQTLIDHIDNTLIKSGDK